MCLYVYCLVLLKTKSFSGSLKVNVINTYYNLNNFMVLSSYQHNTYLTHQRD